MYQIKVIPYPVFALRSKLLIFLFNISKPIYRAVFKFSDKAWTVNLNDLSKKAPGTLGKDLYNFLTQHGFSIEPKLESHDVGHVLLGYDTDVIDEVCMQYFYLGSGKRSIYSVLTVFLGFFILHECHQLFFRAYLRGKKAVNFQYWDFEHLLNEPTSVIQKMIFNRKLLSS